MNCEILIKSQDNMCITDLKFPLTLEYRSKNNKYYMFCGDVIVGSFDGKSNGIKVLDYIIRQRNYYLYNQKEKKCAIINIPVEDEMIDDNGLTEKEGAIIND